ncbi:polymorphic toxin-type HINT domain-containing protein [Longispora albida]|uniref:polymorphic toxin-type HINT domain-containing protein n=1 Tax=Longispora albida TaxID=203523 RepID=UPI0012F8808C|nr:polymorphic toxin-type HINT domain-containing protein [Longispora albida]
MPGTKAGAKKLGADATAGKTRKTAPAPVWPKAGASEVPVLAPAPSLRAAGAQETGAITATAVDAAPALAAARAAEAKPSKLRVEVLDQAKARAAGVHGVVFRAQADQPGKVALRVDYSQFASAFGGDWASRLRIVQLPECALTTPAAAECQAKPFTSRNSGTGSVSADVDLGSGGATADGLALSGAGAAAPMLLAAAASPSGGTGSFAATPLTTSSSWSAGSSSGDFGWSYPMRVPPSLGGPSPHVELSYSSQSVDGLTAATNNQPSWIGQGFDFWPGYIERRYKPCAEDLGGNANNTVKTGDMCWANDNAVMMLGGGGGSELVRDDTTGVWRPKSDDGSKVERLTGAANGDDNGEYWKFTTPDGAQLFFGRNQLPGWSAGKAETASVWTVPVYGNNTGEPCRGATFDASWCQQAWRWNLDHVVDAFGNSMSYWYTRETNYYSRNLTASAATQYTRGGYLSRIDYGTRADAEFTGAPMTVGFDSADRCDTNCASHGSNWTDTPWDQECTGGTCTGKYQPTFWSTKRLSKITTRVWGGSAYREVDSWTLTHTYPDPGDGTQAGLWLSKISHSGLVGGTATVPDVTFGGVQMNNRAAGVLHSPGMNWWRIQSITTETGAGIGVSYSAPECVAGSNMPASPDTNTMRCFPVYWTPDNYTEPVLDWFHKYVVTTVSENDATGNGVGVVTFYEYPGGAAWHSDPDMGLGPVNRLSWAQWRGYDTVRVRKGQPWEQTLSETRYFRGMNGDKLASGTRTATITDSQGGTWPDEDAFAGRAREQIGYNIADNSIVTSQITDPWQSAPTATRTIGNTTTYARFGNSSGTHSRVALDGGRGFRRTDSASQFDTIGLLTQTEATGDGVTATCTRYTYNGSTSVWRQLSRVQSFALPCASSPASAADVLGDTLNSFDGQAYGAAPVKGSITKVEELKTWAAAGSAYATSSRAAYDANGRLTEAWDATGARNTKTYSPAIGYGPLTKATSTNALGHTTTIDVDPAWGLTTASTDPNGKRSDISYDPLGRVTSVWLPGRDKASFPSAPTVGYTYLLRTDGATAVTSRRINPIGGYITSHTLYDSLMRPRQTQAPAIGPDGGRSITDTIYDSAGRAYKTNAAYIANGSPSTDLFLPNGDAVIPSQTVTLFDGAGRPVASVLKSLNTEKWRTSTYYAGDRADVTPPAGGTATSVFIDAVGRQTELRQYHNGAPAGTYDATKYIYGRNGQIASVTDPAGNSWTYAYDQRGLVTKATDPDRGATTYTYNDAGQLQSATDAAGSTIAYAYDLLGRVTGTFTGSTSGAKRTEMTYDTTLMTDGVTQAKGYQSSSTRWVGSDAYTSTVTGYTDRYATTGKTITIPAVEKSLAGSYTLRSTYFADGSPATTQFPAAGGLAKETLSHAYDALGMPTTLKGTLGLSSVNYVTSSQYTRFGEPAVHTFGTSNSGPFVQQGFWYEEGTRRVSRSMVLRDIAPGVAADLNYTYDPSGQITKIADTPQGGTADTQCFNHDYLQRLNQAWTPSSGDCAAAPSLAVLGGAAPYWQSWTFDKSGSRLSQTDHKTAAGKAVTTYTYPAAGQPQPHTLKTASTTDNAGTRSVSYSYDTRGNTTARPNGAGGVQKLAWDAEGHLASTDDGTSYVYDPAGGRLIKRDGTGATLYLGGMELRLTTSSGAVAATRYYSHNGQSIAMRTSSGVTWLLSDHQGTAQIAIKAAASQDVTQRRQTPYGGSRGSNPAWVNSHGFLGGETDPAGLTHLGAREYDPAIGRFLSVDPLIDIGNPQQMHGYAYSGNSPISSSDPSGMIPDDYLDPSLDQPCHSSSGPYTCWLQTEGGSGPGSNKCRPGECYDDGGHDVLDAAGMIPVIGTAADGANAAYYAAEGKWGDAAESAGWAVVGLIPFGKVVGKGSKLIKGGGNSAEDAGKVAKGADNAAKAGAKTTGDSLEESIRAAEAEEKAIQRAEAKAAAAERRGADAAAAEKQAAQPAGAGSSASNAAESTAKGCPHSFDPSTPVQMADGEAKPIADVAIGDEVTATDPSTGVTSKRQVTALHDNLDTDLTELTVAADGQLDHTLSTTQHHPFWDVTTSSWVNAGDLVSGHRLRSLDGAVVTVVTVVNHTGSKRMRDLTVAGDHTYYVVAVTTAVLVHNCGGAVLDLKYKTGWSAAQMAEADAKVAALNNAGRLVVTAVKRSGSAAAVWRKGGNTTQAGKDVDHLIDLQLGGADALGNMWLLDSSVNRSLGAQISRKIRKLGLKPGDVVCSLTITPRC